MSSYKFINSCIKRDKNKILVFLKCKSKSFGKLQTCCKIHVIFKKKTCQSILDFLKKNA
jgi:hypothetical protein